MSDTRSHGYTVRDTLPEGSPVTLADGTEATVEQYANAGFRGIVAFVRLADGRSVEVDAGTLSGVIPTCECMTEDPGDGYGERVVTHSARCPLHPEADAYVIHVSESTDEDGNYQASAYGPDDAPGDPTAVGYGPTPAAATAAAAEAQP